MDAQATLNGCPLYDTDDTKLVLWIARFTGTCVYGNMAGASWTLGIISLTAWLGAQMPQIIANHQNASVDGLSLAFLANWFLGDFTNFVGCVLTHQLPFQTLLAFYYICVDLVLSGQYYYYTRPHRRHNHEAHLRHRKSHRHTLNHNHQNHPSKPTDSSAIAADEEEETAAHSHPLTIPSKTRTVSFNLKSLVTSSFLASFTKVRSMPLPSDEPRDNTDLSSTLVKASSAAFMASSISTETVGEIFAWACAMLYLTSRLPQIYKNYQRKSTSGTSILLFAAALTGNVTYTLSILLSPQATGPGGLKFLVNELPFLLGAAGTVMFDLTIFIQWYIYKEDSADSPANFLPTTPHYYHHHSGGRQHHGNDFKYEILENNDVSDTELDATDLDVARATAEGEADSSTDGKQKSRVTVRQTPSIPLLPTHSHTEDTPLATSPQGSYDSL